MFNSREELRQFTKGELKKTEELIIGAQKETNETQQQIANLNNSSFNLREECRKEQKKLYDALDEKSKQLLSEKDALEKKKSNCRWFGFAILIAYVALAYLILFVLKVEFPIADILVYLSAAILAIILYAVSVSIKRAPIKKKISEIYGEGKISEYYKKHTQLGNEYGSKISQNEDTISDLEEKIHSLENYIKKFEETKTQIIQYLDELDVHWEYRDAILFCGKQSGTVYDIYIDGLLYDKVKRNNPIKIKLTPGLHSFKVEYVEYNIDNSVLSSYTFNTIQIEIDPEKAPILNAFVSNYKSLERVNAAEFEKKAKIKLL